MINIVNGAATPSIAFLTLSVVIRPFPARFVISAALLAPEDRQAMVVFERILPEPAARRVRKLYRLKPVAMVGVLITGVRRAMIQLPTARCRWFDAV